MLHSAPMPAETALEAANHTADGNGPNRTRQKPVSGRDVLFSRDKLLRTLDANVKTRDYLWRGRPGFVGISQKMYTDPVMQNATAIRVNPLVSNQAIWRVEPPKDATPYEVEASAFVEWMLLNCIDFKEMIRFVANARHRIGVANVEYTDNAEPISTIAFPSHPRPSGGVVLTGWHPIPAYSIKEYVPGVGKSAEALIQYVDGGHERVIPITRNLIMRWTVQQEGKNFFGTPTSRAAYGDWSQKILMQVVRLMKHERFGLGTPYAKAAKGASKADQEKVAAYLEDLRANESGYFVLPNEWEVDILVPTIEHGTTISEDIQTNNLGIYEAFTNGVASMGTGKFGSNALAQTQDNHLDNAIEADASHIASVINHGVDGWSLIRRYTEMNYPGARPGKLVGSNFSQAANYKYMEIVAQLMSSGAMRPYAEMEDFLADKLVAPKAAVPFVERTESVRQQRIESVTDEDEDQEEEESDEN